MLDETFNDLADLALRLSGQHIPASKSYLMDARLGPIARREGFGSLDELAQCLRARPNPVFEAEIAAALTAKETRFFREPETLQRVLTEVLPDRLKATNNGRLRVWCAGGSTGQEAYSLAMMLQDEAPQALAGARIDLISTDLCKVSTERARRGDFGHFEVQRGLSVHRLLRHFERQETGDWRIGDALRGRVSFREHNLMDDLAGLGMFDVVLCRHVLSGIAQELRGPIADRIAGQLTPGGVVLLGLGESLGSISQKLEPSNRIRGAYVAAGTAEAEAA